jgi:hypothetical protein
LRAGMSHPRASSLSSVHFPFHMLFPRTEQWWKGIYVWVGTVIASSRCRQ